MKGLFTFLTLLLGLTLGAQVIFEQDFEDGLPSDWTAEVAWEHGNANSLSSSAFPIPDNGSFMGVNDDGPGQGVNTSGWLISPEIDLTTSTGPVLSFEAFFINGDYDANEEALIQITTDGGTTWNSLMELGGEDSWKEEIIDLQDYTGNVVQIAFEYKDGGGWNYGFCVDNVRVSQLGDKDITLEGLTGGRFVQMFSYANISGVVKNFGTETLNSFDVTWTDGTATHTETITGLNLDFGETYEFVHSTPFPVAEAITYDIEVTVSNPNGGTDTNPADNTLTSPVSGVSYVPTKRVVGEEGTGTWCGWCPRGFVWIEYMHENYPETFIAIAVHNGDPMVVPEYDGNIGFAAFPSSHVDRVIRNSDPANFEQDYLQQITQIAPIDVSVEAAINLDTRLAVIDAKVNYVTQLDDMDYRLSVVMVEDSVQGTGSQYGQANYYSFQSQNIPLEGGGFNWQEEPSTIPASQMYYNEVARALLGGIDGVAGSLPAEAVAGDEATYSFTYEVPEGYDHEQMRAVVLVLDNETGAIINAVQGDLMEAMVSSTEEVAAGITAEIFPNPFQDQLTMDLNIEGNQPVSIQVFDAIGKVVGVQQYGELSGEVRVQYNSTNLPEGTYTVHLRVGDAGYSERVILVR